MGLSRITEIRNKRVFVTGHTGFKGTWLTMLLLKLGAVVGGYSLPVQKGSFYDKVRPVINMHNEEDIRNSMALQTALEKFEPEIVIHLASHSSLNNSLKIPAYIFETNIMGVVNLLEAVRKTGSVKVVLVITSDKCYDVSKGNGTFNEKNPLWGNEPYGVSKVCQEIMTDCYRSALFSNDIMAATARASNVIGGGDYNQSRLIPYLMNCFLQKETAKLRNPSAIRPWQSVMDVLYGYLLLVGKLYDNYGISDEYCSAFNFGPGEDGFASVHRITQLVSSHFNNAGYLFESSMPNGVETEILKLDSQKAQKILNWNPLYSLEQILKSTVEFNMREREGESAAEICNAYWERYLKEVTEFEK